MNHKHNIKLKEKNSNEISKILAKEFGIKNNLALPKIVKVVVNTGIGEANKHKELLQQAIADLAIITGQKPSIRKAKISVASFGLRKGMPVGLKVTLRKDRMYVFLEKLFSVVLPRLRDFRGVPKKSFDKYGNYTIGLEEHTVFPEIDLTKAMRTFGLEITIVTSTKDKKKSERLLELLGMPFEKE